MATKVTRPALRYHGGKWRLANWIVSHFPAHRTYVEPFGGAASVLLRKPRSYAEVYNDLDSDVVGLFRVLRSARAGELIHALRMTPFAREEFEGAYEPSDDPVERARRLVIRSFMGFGSDGFNRAVRTGFRANVRRSGSTPAADWTSTPDALQSVADRFSGVVIENRPALEVLRHHDAPDTMHYVDPPYLPTTRSQKSRCSGARYHAYVHEMDAAGHAEMLNVLNGLSGAVVVSGYPSPLYDEALAEWRRVECAAMADGARPRVEVLWLNAAAQRRDLFSGVAWNALGDKIARHRERFGLSQRGAAALSGVSGPCRETRNPPGVPTQRVLTRASDALRYCDNPTPSGHKITTAKSLSTATHSYCQRVKSQPVPIMDTS
jgi:DNA adenine methylase